MKTTNHDLAAVPSTALFTDFIARAREWQRRNPEWQLLCDMGDTSSLYETFGELPKAERMAWVGKYREEAVEMWKEYGVPKCKVPRAILNDRLELVDDWPTGNAMTVFMVNVTGQGTRHLVTGTLDPLVGRFFVAL